MAANVRKKLWEIDHLLDEDYETFKVNFTETITVEVPEMAAGNSKGNKRSKLVQRTERKEVSVENDLTILKDPKGFVSRLIEERGLWEPDILKRISIDGGDKSVKMILNTVDKHYDPEVSISKWESRGSCLAGVNRSIVMCYCENLEENYNNIHIIFELLRMDQLDFVIAADYKLLNILLGLSSHGGKYACIYCEAPKGLDCGAIRTYGRINECYSNFKKAGGITKNMKEFANVIHQPLINMDMKQTVLGSQPLPELHLLMGAVNHKLELIWHYLMKIESEDLFWKWCDHHGITRRGKKLISYHFYRNSL